MSRTSDHDASGQVMARLVYSEGADVERTFRLNPGDPEVLVGRDRACMIRTTRRNVSRRHCAIRWTPDGFEVRDLESANGTFVNGREIGRHILTDNDEVRCGLNFRIWFQLGTSNDRVSRNHVFLNFDQPILERVGDRIQVGRAFVFVPRGLFDNCQPPMPWVSALLGEAAARPRVLPLMGSRTLDIPGVRIRPLSAPGLRLMSITSDKSLYRANLDSVHLCVFDPLNPGRLVELTMYQSDQELSRRTLTLDSNGLGLLTMTKLPPGGYRVAVQRAEAAPCTCRFQVTEYRKAPLTVYAEEIVWDTHQLRGVLWVDRFGKPADTTLRIQLIGAGTTLHDQKVIVRGGRVDIQLRAYGDGPFEMMVCLESDQSTNSIVSIGERPSSKETLMSGLGTEFYGSNQALEGARPLRGLYIHEGGVQTTPIHMEQIGDTRVRITPMTAVESLCVVVSDPTCPQLNPDLVSAAEVSHPALADNFYQRGEALFQEGEHQKARASFEAGRSRLRNPHPYYAYYIACCLTREGDLAGAVRALKQAIDDGWADLEQLETDEDLCLLKGRHDFESLLRHGQNTWTYSDIAAGHALEFDVPDVVSVVSVGAFIDGRAWEGWGCTLSPARLNAEVRCPDLLACGEEAQITVEANPGASIYLLAREALYTDEEHTGSQLASQLSLFMQSSTDGQPGWVADTLHDAISPKKPSHRSNQEMPLEDELGKMIDPAFSSKTAGRPPIPTEQSVPVGQGSTLTRRSAERSRVLCAEPARVGPDGRATLVFTPPRPGEVRVDTLVAQGGDWDVKTDRISVKGETIELSIPPFIHPLDSAEGRLIINAGSGPWRPGLEHDGQPIPLSTFEGVTVEDGELFDGASHEVFSFPALPGIYHAHILAPDGTPTSTVVAQADVPGVFRGEARAIVVLTSGESISMRLGSDVQMLRPLPSLAKPMDALIDVLCQDPCQNCEQAAAWTLAAGVMWAWGDDAARRHATALLCNGITRLKTMWLQDEGGFKIYPGARREPDRRYGLLAARHLLLLAHAVLEPSLTMTPAIETLRDAALDMAILALKRDHRAQAKVAAMSSEQVYIKAIEGAPVAGLLKRIDHLTPAGTLPPVSADAALLGNTAVARRTEACYAAAACLRLDADRGRAISLMNLVLSKLDARGGLHSSLDSVAALMMLHEARRGDLLSALQVKADGHLTPLAEASARSKPTYTLLSVNGNLAVEVARRHTEDWGPASTNLSIRVALEKGGRTCRQFVLGEMLELVVVVVDENPAKVGDVLHVCLPDALSRAVGGAQHKRFTVAFRGQHLLRVPLIATSTTLGTDGKPVPQRFTIRVSNTYDEKRGASPGWLQFSVAAK